MSDKMGAGPHGPTSERIMRHYYGASGYMKPNPGSLNQSWEELCKDCQEALKFERAELARARQQIENLRRLAPKLETALQRGESAEQQLASAQVLLLKIDEAARNCVQPSLKIIKLANSQPTDALRAFVEELLPKPVLMGNYEQEFCHIAEIRANLEKKLGEKS